MVSVNKKVRTSLLLVPLCLFLFSCNESEFYEKEYLDDLNVDRDISNDNGDGNINEPKNPTTTTPPKVDEPKVDKPKVEKPKEDEPKVVNEEPKVEEPKVDKPKVEEPKKDEPKVVNEEPKVEEPKVDKPKVEEPKVKLEDVKNYFTQNLSEKAKVDILWVIDDSGSMSDEQKALAYNFDIFIREFLEKKIDFKMAITTTDARTSTRKRRGRSGSYYTLPAKNGRMIGNPNDLTSAAAAKNESLFYKNFARYINVGTRGSGRERGLHTSVSFLKRYHESFFRKEAFTIIVYVSDEEDQSSKKTKEYVKAYQDTKDNAGMVKIYSIVTKKKTRRWESVGSRYIAASEMTGGTSAHIKGDFYTILRDMGGEIVNLTDSFALSQTPYDDKVIVEVAGNTVDPVTYEFDSSSRTVKFKKGFLPGEGAKITVSYQVEVKNNSVLLGSN